MHVNVAGVEACFTIGKVKSPHAHETRWKAKRLHLSRAILEGVMPTRQRSSVIGAEGKVIDHCQTGTRGLNLDLRRARQHSAGENVALDEVGATPG